MKEVNFMHVLKNVLFAIGVFSIISCQKNLSGKQLGEVNPINDDPYEEPEVDDLEYSPEVAQSSSSTSVTQTQTSSNSQSSVAVNPADTAATIASLCQSVLGR